MHCMNNAKFPAKNVLLYEKHFFSANENRVYNKKACLQIWITDTL